MSFDFGRAIRRVTKTVPAAAWLFVPVIRLKDSLQTKEMHRELEDCCQKFFSAEQRADGRFLRKIKRDVWYSFLRYHCPVDEYFLYQFYRLSPSARHEFVTEYEKEALCQAMSSEATREIFADKGKAYQRFSRYYKRDALILDKTTSFEAFSRFAALHTRYIVKPCKESCGRGIRIVDGEPPTEALFQQYRQEYVVLEEIICQNDALARFHPTSVNTIRCATFLQNGTPHILFTFLRMGRGDSIVDNGGAGGLIASIEADTGIITTPGITENGYSTIFHPDTGVQILGSAIPQWEQMKRLAEELAMVIPEHPYVSWDLALTPDGWVMVEGNSAGQFVGPQLTTQRGMRAFLSQYFDL